MVNLIGRCPSTKDLLEIPGARVHLYGKAPREGRKLGHVTVVAEHEHERTETADRLLALADAAGGGAVSSANGR